MIDPESRPDFTKGPVTIPVPIPPIPKRLIQRRRPIDTKDADHAEILVNGDMSSDAHDELPVKDDFVLTDPAVLKALGRGLEVSVKIEEGTEVMNQVSSEEGEK